MDEPEIEKVESPEQYMEAMEPQQMHFEEDAEIMEAAEEAMEPMASDYIEEDDMMEDVQEQPHSDNQADYFTREAGVGSHEEPKSSGGRSMGFYEDK